jgi:phosphoenolpyruvate carboxylase
MSLPRAITFAGGCYSLGAPAELFGLGSALASLSSEELVALKKHYRYFVEDILAASQYINWENIHDLADTHPAWKKFVTDTHRAEKILGIQFEANTEAGRIHACITRQAYLLQKDTIALSRLIGESGVVRKALG